MDPVGKTRAPASRWSLLITAAAWLLVAAFAIVPALAREHDHLSANDRTPTFKFSKNIERPHEKPGPLRLIVTGLTPIADDRSRGDRVSSSDAPLGLHRRFSGPAPVRAPPAR